MFCTSCGTKNNEDGNYCKQCGCKLDKPAHARISELDFERAMPEDEQVTLMLERAYRARKDGDRLGAIALCREALSLRPNSTSCHSLLGQLYEQGGERDQAIEQYEQVLALNPGSIADRVKLDELRGDVPSVVSAKHAQPHIVLADRGKDNTPFDYRVPSLVVAAVALMVLGGVFTMQMLTRQANSPRGAGDASRLTAGNSNAQSNPPQNNSVIAQQQIPGQSAVVGTQSPTYSDLTAGLDHGPIIIQNPPAPAGRGYSGQSYEPAPITVAENSHNRPATTSNSAQDDNKDIGGSVVRLASPDDNSGSATGDKGQIGDSSPPAPKNIGTIKVNPGGQESPSVAAETSTGSNTHKNEAMADLLVQQGQYKQAGDAYLRALDGAGDETAYIYRQAAWCFEKSGQKVTAVNYYRQGIDAAQKLVTHQPEIAKNLIRACQTGIKACSD